MRDAEPAQKSERLALPHLAGEPAPVPEFDTEIEAAHALHAQLDMGARRRLADQPRRELEVDEAEPPGRLQRQQGLAKAPPQLVDAFAAEVAIEKARSGGGAERLLQVAVQYGRRSLVTGEEAKRLDVHDEAFGGALGPELRGGRRRHRVVARIDLDDRKLRRVKAQPGLGRSRVLRIETTARDERLVGPGRGADKDRHANLRCPFRLRRQRAAADPAARAAE